MALSSFALKATFVTLGIIALVFAIVLPALVQAEDPVPYSGKLFLGTCFMAGCTGFYGDRLHLHN